jgi:hypothetical protein
MDSVDRLRERHAETVARAEMLARVWVDCAPIPSRETCAELDLLVASLRVASDAEKDAARAKLLVTALNLLGTTALVLERARLEFDARVSAGRAECRRQGSDDGDLWIVQRFGHRV